MAKEERLDEKYETIAKKIVQHTIKKNISSYLKKHSILQL